MKFSVLWKWFDFWVGAYWDVGHRTLYVCPLPTVVLRFEFRGPKDESKHRTDRNEAKIVGTPIEPVTPSAAAVGSTDLVMQFRELLKAAELTEYWDGGQQQLAIGIMCERLKQWKHTWDILSPWIDVYRTHEEDMRRIAAMLHNK